MFSYTFEVALTLLFGPVFYMIYRVYMLRRSHKRHEVGEKKDKLITCLSELQITFFDTNIFLIFSSAAASLVRIQQGPMLFELAEMQVLMSLQALSLLISLFTLIHPVERRGQRFIQFIVGYALAITAMQRSQINDDGPNSTNWKMAVAGCAANSNAYRTITPLVYPGWLVILFSVFSAVAFVMQIISTEWDLQTKRQKWRRGLFGLEVVSGMLVSASIVGMVFGLYLLWKQRADLINIVKDLSHDGDWGFGQVAALFAWMVIPVEIWYQVCGKSFIFSRNLVSLAW